MGGSSYRRGLSYWELTVHNISFLLLQKFVCITIRPTLLPYKEVYDYDGCAQFVSDYLTFVPLDPPIDLVNTL